MSTSRKNVIAASGLSSSVRVPPRIVLVPDAPRKARTASALASVATSSIDASSRSATGPVSPRAPHSPPAAATVASRASTSSGVSSASQPTPKMPSSTGWPLMLSRPPAASITASHNGLRSPGSLPCAITSPPTSTSTSRSHLSASIASASPAATLLGPMLTSISTVGWSRNSDMRASANTTSRSRTRVSGPASRMPGAISSAPVISATERGPGTGSNGRRSQLMPPITGSAPSYRRADSAAASAPTTSPPPPMPITSGRRQPRSSSSASRILLVLSRAVRSRCYQAAFRGAGGGRPARGSTRCIRRVSDFPLPRAARLGQAAHRVAEPVRGRTARTRAPERPARPGPSDPRGGRRGASRRRPPEARAAAPRAARGRGWRARRVAPAWWSRWASATNARSVASPHRWATVAGSTYAPLTRRIGTPASASTAASCSLRRRFA